MDKIYNIETVYLVLFEYSSKIKSIKKFYLSQSNPKYASPRAISELSKINSNISMLLKLTKSMFAVDSKLLKHFDLVSQKSLEFQILVEKSLQIHNKVTNVLKIKSKDKDNYAVFEVKKNKRKLELNLANNSRNYYDLDSNSNFVVASVKKNFNEDIVELLKGIKA